MAKIAIEGREFVVYLAPPERLVAFRKEVRVPLTTVRTAGVQPKPQEAAILVLFPALARYPEGSPARELPAPSDAAGPAGQIALLPFKMQLVTISRTAKAFVAVYGRGPAVRVNLDEPAPFTRMLLTVRDPRSTVAAIRAAIGK